MRSKKLRSECGHLLVSFAEASNCFDDESHHCVRQAKAAVDVDIHRNREGGHLTDSEESLCWRAQEALSRELPGV